MFRAVGVEERTVGVFFAWGPSELRRLDSLGGVWWADAGGCAWFGQSISSGWCSSTNRFVRYLRVKHDTVCYENGSAHEYSSL